MNKDEVKFCCTFIYKIQKVNITVQLGLTLV